MDLKIANAAGFLGDDLAAPRRLLDGADVDYLTLEYLAELTMSILARQRDKNPAAGFARDWLDVLATLIPILESRPRLRIVTNAGGMNPRAGALATARMLADAGMPDLPIAVVDGDDLLPRLDELREAGCDFANLETGEPLQTLQARIVSANAYLGARPIAAALERDARIVITGRVADASLTVGPAVHEFGWSWTDWNRLAAATVAGHLIECGAQVTGGYSTSWPRFDLHRIGYPIAELTSDGGVTIAKPAGSGGAVTRQTVAEQLVYEIDNPARYLTPDVVANFQNVALRQVAVDRIRVEGAEGEPATGSYKVSLAYEDGYASSGQLLVWGEDCLAKARQCADLILGRLSQAGFNLERTNVELLGAGDGVPGWEERGEQANNAIGQPDGLGAESLQIQLCHAPREVVLRIAVHDPRIEAVSRFVRQFAPLITAGPAGLAGYAGGRAPVRPVYAYWPTLVPKHLVAEQVEVSTAREWLS